MTEILASECVECANVSGSGPNGGRLQCRSCGRWLGEQHPFGCPVGAKARAAARPVPKGEPEIVRAAVESAVSETARGAMVPKVPRKPLTARAAMVEDAPPVKPKRKRRSKK